ncbi:MAG: hypothetical protein RhofKO_29000 [Rhodothermales bacterium]
MPSGSLRLLIRTQALLARRDVVATLRDTTGVFSLFIKAYIYVMLAVGAVSVGVAWPEFTAMQRWTSGSGLFLLSCLMLAIADWLIRPNRGQRLTRYLPWPFSRTLLSRFAQAMVPFNAITSLPYLTLIALTWRHTADPDLTLSFAQGIGAVLIVLGAQYVGSVIQLVAAPCVRTGLLVAGGILAALALDLIFEGLIAQFMHGLLEAPEWSWLQTSVVAVVVASLVAGSVLLAQRRLFMMDTHASKPVLRSSLQASNFIRQIQLRLVMRNRLIRMQLLVIMAFLALQVYPVLERGQVLPLVFVISMASLAYAGSALPFNSVGFDGWAALPIHASQLLAQIVLFAHGLTLLFASVIAIPLLLYASHLIAPSLAIVLYSLGVSNYTSVCGSLFVSRRLDPHGKLYESAAMSDNFE